MHEIFTAQTANTTAYGLKVASSCDVTLDIYGTWGGASVAVHRSNDNGATYLEWSPDGTPITFTADKQVTYAAGPGQRFSFVVTGATGTTSLNAYGGGDFVTLIDSADG